MYGNPADFLGMLIPILVALGIGLGIAFIIRLLMSSGSGRRGYSSGGGDNITEYFLIGLADFLRLIGVILKWLGKGFVFLIMLLISALKREPVPPMPGTSSADESSDDYESDEDDKESSRKPPKIDEYHV